MFESRSVALGVVIALIVVVVFCMLPVKYETVKEVSQTRTKEVLVTREVSFPSPLIGEVVEFKYKKPFAYEFKSDRFGDDIEIWISNEEKYNDGRFDISIDYTYSSQGKIKEDNFDTSIFVGHDSTEYLDFSASDVGVSATDFLNWEDVFIDPPTKQVTVKKVVESAEDLEETVSFLENVSYEVGKISVESKSGILLDVLRGKGRFTGFGF